MSNNIKNQKNKPIFRSSIKEKNDKFAIEKDDTTSEKKKNKINKLTCIIATFLVVVLPFFAIWITGEINSNLLQNKKQSLVEERKGWSVSTVPNTRLTSNQIHVSDPDMIIDDIYEDSINVILSDIREKSDIFIVALNKIDKYDGDAFANELFNHWGIGEKGRDNGVLVLMTKEPHFIRIETGYGMEEILPDVVCHRVIRDNVLPYFKLDRYSEGLLSCAKSLVSLVDGVDYDGIVKVDANSLAQSLEKKPNVTLSNDYSWRKLISEVVSMWYMLSVFVGLFLSLYHIYALYSIYKLYLDEKKHDTNVAYATVARVALSKKKNVWLSLLFPLTIVTSVWFIVLGLKYRRKERVCRKCHRKMRLLSESEEDNYLTKVNGKEDDMDVIDYDVWLCECGQKIIDYYEGSNYSSYEECPKCGARLYKLVKKEIVKEATYSAEGAIVEYYACVQCHHTHSMKIKVPKLSSSRSGSGSYGGSGGGGSFGGGCSGGGGSSSHW